MLRAREEAVLERYVPAALVRELVRTGDPLTNGREVDITVILVDIRGYTQRAERLTPREAVAFLNRYFAVVVAPLAAEGAVLDKYLGDGVLAFFEGDEHPRRALRAARAILAAIASYNETRPLADAVTIGIALHTGPALVGTIGAEQKREYTAVANAVNLTARLEELNKTFGSSLVASEAVLEAATGHGRGAGWLRRAVDDADSRKRGPAPGAIPPGGRTRDVRRALSTLVSRVEKTLALATVRAAWHERPVFCP
jgi:adenylate cyclase